MSFGDLQSCNIGPSTCLIRPVERRAKQRTVGGLIATPSNEGFSSSKNFQNALSARTLDAVGKRLNDMPYKEHGQV